MPPVNIGEHVCVWVFIKGIETTLYYGSSAQLHEVVYYNEFYCNLCLEHKKIETHRVAY